MKGERRGSLVIYGEGVRRRSGYLVVASRTLFEGSRCWWHRKLCCALARLRRVREWDQDAGIVPLPLARESGVESATTADPGIADGSVRWCPRLRRVACGCCVSDS